MKMKTVVINICGMKSERCLEGNHSMKWLYQKKTKGLKKKKINNVRKKSNGIQQYIKR